MTKPKMIGTINAFIRTAAYLPKSQRHFDFDGTISGMVTRAISAGAKPGDIVIADWSGRGSKDPGNRYRITPAEGKAPIWAVRA